MLRGVESLFFFIDIYNETYLIVEGSNLRQLSFSAFDNSLKHHPAHLNPKVTVKISLLSIDRLRFKPFVLDAI